MKELFYLMFTVYKRSRYSDSQAYGSAILVLASIRMAIFFPLVCMCITLTDNRLTPIVLIFCLISFWIYAKKRAPKIESCISKKKYCHVSCPRLLMYVIVMSFWISSAIVSVYSANFIRDYGLEGWLFRFFN